MIQSLQISGYKLFKDLRIPKLGTLNLFVGANNTGKSCLLEAVGLYAGRTPISDVLQTASLRSQQPLRRWEPEGWNEEGTALRHPVFDLFHWDEREDPSAPRGVIKIAKLVDTNGLRVEYRWHDVVTDFEGVPARRYIEVLPGNVTTDHLELALPVFRGEKQVALITRRYLPIRNRTLDSDRLFNDGAAVVAHVPACGYTDDKAASLWDGLIQGPGQDQVIECLRLIDPRIEDLDFIAGRLGSRVPLLKVKGAGRIPLQSMGDGLRRLFHIGLGMATARHGILLIDEFETGLYWEVQEQVWRALFGAAKMFSLQVFATTHSSDCIRAFIKAQDNAESSNENLVYRLEREGAKISARELPLENLEAALNQHVEVR